MAVCFLSRARGTLFDRQLYWCFLCTLFSHCLPALAHSRTLATMLANEQRTYKVCVCSVHFTCYIQRERVSHIWLVKCMRWPILSLISLCAFVCTHRSVSCFRTWQQQHNKAQRKITDDNVEWSFDCKRTFFFFSKKTHTHIHAYANWINRIVRLFSSCCWPASFHSFSFTRTNKTANMQKKSSYNHAVDVLLILVNGQHVFHFVILLSFCMF